MKNNSYHFENIWNECVSFNIEQKPEEFKKLLDFLNDNSKLKFALEIGSNYGGTTVGLCNLFENVITIDINHSSNFDLIKQKYNTYSYIIGDSKSNTTIEYLKSLNIKFDFIFIDGDHSYEGVKSDYYKYKQFLNDDGYIAFHDIVESEENKNNNINVYQFWSELKNEYNEIHEFINLKKELMVDTNNMFHEIMKSQSYETWGGIGLVKNFKLSVFSHNYLSNEWMPIVQNQFELLKNSGLYKRADVLYYGIYADSDVDYYLFLSLLKKYDEDEKVNVTRYSENNFEYNTLVNLQNYCNLNRNGIVFYFHSKGTSKTIQSESLKSWRNCLEHYNIKLWRTSFINLKNNAYDISGALYIDVYKNSVREYRNYYSGNFWWSSCSYITKLPNLLYLKEMNKNSSDPSDVRMQCELWIGKSFHRWVNLHCEVINGHETHIYKTE